jgi:2'-hydroxyisoflavone reductase
MRALVIGGTRFVGAAIVDELANRGAEITLFTRGLTNRELFPGLDHIRGDRATDLERLGNRGFDVVFDSCGYHASQVRPSAALAADKGAFYVFVSTASVYALDADDDVVTEDHALEMPSDMEAEAEEDENYAEGKVRCERTLRDALGDRLAILRPGLVVGPRDYTDRYAYWVWRLGVRGTVLVPGDGTDPMQMIDARDMAAFAVDVGTQGTTGVFNVTGPSDAVTFAELIEHTTPVDREPELCWASHAFLVEHQVEPWRDLPCWLPHDHKSAAVLRLDTRRAQAAGLRTRPWSETAANTRGWMSDRRRQPPFTAGLTVEREHELLTALRVAE